MRKYNVFLVNCLWLSKNGKLSVFFFLLFPMLIFAWTTPVNISNTEALSTYPAMCQDRRGWLHVVWMDYTTGDADIYYTFYDRTVWADTLNISNDHNTCITPDVAVDTMNNVHVVWADFSNGRIKWAMYDGNSWSTPVSISDSVPYACQGPELDVSHITNNVHCVWHNLGDAEIWHAYYNGSVWSIPENVTQDSNDDAWVDVAVDLLGRVHLVWMDYGSGSMDSIEIFYSRFDSISWTPPVNASRTVGASVDPRITTDNDNNPRVVWEERKNGYSVYYTYFDGVDWANPMLVDVDFSSKPDISVDEEDYSHILWKHKNADNDIYYAVYQDTNQIDSAVNISNTSGASAMPSVEIDSTNIHVIWYDETSGNGEVYYSRGEISGINDSSNIKGNNLSYSSFVTTKLNLLFSLSKTTDVSINIYDITGRKIEEKSLGILHRGSHHYEILLDISSGIYFLNVEMEKKIWCGKIILINP